MKTKLAVLLTTLLAAFAVTVWAQGHDHDGHSHEGHGHGPAADDHANHAGDASAFDEIVQHYEQIRLALLHDSLEQVAQHAKAIERRVDLLMRGFEPGEAGVAPERAAEIKTLLPELRSRAAKLAQATTLSGARDAMGELTKPLVRYREAIAGPRPVVAYCSMVKKAWLQPAGELGNPYGGQKMPRCGEIVSK